MDISKTIAETRARIRHGYPWWLRPLLLRGVAGITLGRRIYLDSGISPLQSERFLRHELTHVRQIARVGFVRFYWQYIAEYVQNRRKGMSSVDAYRNISFEREATEAEQPFQG